jgi:hypothetical protein
MARTSPFNEDARWLRGQVVEYYPSTHSYKILAGGHVFEGVQRLLDHPGDSGGLPRDTLVAMHRELGEWVIAGILTRSSAGQPELAKVKVTEVRGQGADDVLAPPAGIGDARAYNAPTDLGKSDWSRNGDLGQLLAIMNGGAVLLKGSELAQIRALGDEDKVQIVSHLFNHITAMGEANVTVDGQKVAYRWDGAANTADAYDEKYSIHLEVGATQTGDIFSFRITPAGTDQTLAKIAMTVNGRLELRGTSELTTVSGASSEVVGGDKSSHVEGARTDSTVGDFSISVGGRSDLTVSKDLVSTVGGSRRAVTNTNDISFVGGVEKRKVMGSIPPSPGTPAAAFEYIQGGVEWVIGNPVSGALPAQQSANWIGYAGPFNFITQPLMGKGGFNVVSSLPASVSLGCDGMAVPKPDGTHEVVALPAPFGVMKFEPWLTLFQTLLMWMDTHTHQGIIMSSPPVIPATPLVTPLIPLVRSQRVSVGL